MPVELPIFHLGTYTAQNGTPVTFTQELLRQMERNTNLVIRTSKFQPPVGYDHPAARDTSAHGFISGVRYDNGKLIATLDGTSEQLRADAKNFKRLTYSPEFHDDFSFVHEGKPVKVGPTVIGLAMLGAQRGAIKNSAMVPLSEVAFGENVSDVEALLLREDLRAMGYVGEYVADGKFFGEVENDTSRFFEEQENAMTADELKAINDTINAGIKAAVEPLNAKIESQGATIKQFGEEAKTRAKVTELVETIGTEKKLSKISRTRLEEALMTPTTDTVRAFAESISPVVLPGTAKKDDDTKGETDEPAALAAVRPKHFSDPNEHGDVLEAGLIAFGEFKPEAFKGIESNPSEQLAKLRGYITTRDTAAN